MRRLRTIVVRPFIRSTPEPIKTHRDWIAFTISIVSFLISILSFYFSTLLQQDDVRLVVEHTPELMFDSDGLNIFGDVGIVFINSGNRAASVMALKATARRAKLDEGVDAPCLIEEWATNLFDFGIEPFVLKPGDIATLQSKRLTGIGIKKKGDKDYYIMDKKIFLPKDGDVVLVCSEATLVTPDNVILSWKQPIYRYVFRKQYADVDFMDVEAQPLFDTKKPIIVISGNQWFGKLRSAF